MSDSEIDIGVFLKGFLLSKLPKYLYDDYGKSDYYTWKQVYKSVERHCKKRLNSVEYAYAVFCTKEVYDMQAKACSYNFSYNGIRSELGIPIINDEKGWNVKGDPAMNFTNNCTFSHVEIANVANNPLL